MGYFFLLINRLGQTFLMGTGVHLTFSIGGMFFLGFPTVVKVSSYALAISERNGVSPELAFGIGIVTSLLSGLFFGILFLKLSSDSFAVLGLVSIVATEALARSWDSVTNGVLGLPGIVRPEFMQSAPFFSLVTVVLALSCLIFEYVFLQTRYGRYLRAFKEQPQYLEAQGVSSRKVAVCVLLISNLLLGIGGMFTLWQVQFIDPSFGGLPLLIELFTLGIIALKPKVRFSVFGALFVVFLPEVLRFLPLPTSMFGYLRILIYSMFLIGFLLLFRKRISISQRSF